jgi:hypothetical protein
MLFGSCLDDLNVFGKVCFRTSACSFKSPGEPPKRAFLRGVGPKSSKQAKAHQSKPKQAKADHSSPKQAKASQSEPKQAKAIQSKPKRYKANQAGPSLPGSVLIKPKRSEPIPFASEGGHAPPSRSPSTLFVALHPCPRGVSCRRALPSPKSDPVLFFSSGRKGQSPSRLQARGAMPPPRAPPPRCSLHCNPVPRGGLLCRALPSTKSEP